MGGDHHHEIKLPKISDPSVYKVEEVPELMKIQERLAAKGLKDPWLRNHVWRFQLRKGLKHPKWVFLNVFTHSWKIWVPLVGLTIAAENFLGIDYHGHVKGLDHGDDHGGHH